MTNVPKSSKFNLPSVAISYSKMPNDQLEREKTQIMVRELHFINAINRIHKYKNMHFVSLYINI